MTAGGRLWWWAGNLDIDEWPVPFVGISVGPSRDCSFRRWVTERLKVGDREHHVMKSMSHRYGKLQNKKILLISHACVRDVAIWSIATNCLLRLVLLLPSIVATAIHQ
jgi:hypothetical protein